MRCSFNMKFFKCVLWAIKEYANVGIAVALFLLIGLQIEKQYRSTRFFENCITQDWTEQGFDIKTKYVNRSSFVKIDEELETIVALCTNVRKKAPLPFNYFKGRTHQYINDYDF